MKFLTNLIFEPQGKHNSSLAYNIKDTVMSADGSKVYFALQDVPAGIALTNQEYWQLQIDLSSSKSAMDEALVSFGNYAKEIGTRVKGETAKASGNPVACLADAGSLLQPVTVLTPKQAGSGEPSPDNIRPITGYDKLGLNSAGKNLLPNEGESSLTQNGITITKNADGSITVNGTATGNVVYIVKREPISIPTGKYVVSGIPTGATGKFYATFYDGQDNTGVRYDIGSDDKTVNMSSGYIYYFRVVVQMGTVVNNVTYYPMIRRASIADATYVPYQGKLYTVQIGQTVYGGRMDWLTGKLVADIAMTTLTGTEDWTASATNTAGKSRFYAPGIAVGILPPPDSNTVAEGLSCSHYKAAPSTLNGTFRCVQSIGVFTTGATYFYDDKCAEGTAGDWKAYVAAQYAAGTPIQFTYKLTTPIEIQLTPHIISAVEPEQTNTLYGDGSIEVEYVKPLHVSIDERVAAAVAAAMQN